MRTDRPRALGLLSGACAQASLILAMTLPAVPASAQEPPAGSPQQEAPPEAILFGKKCGGCHSIGEGDRTGPDLLGVTTRRDKAWLTAFIRNAGSVIDSGDAVANELLTKFKGVRMPEQVLSDDELASLLGYLGACDAKGGCRIVTGQTKKAGEATPADIESGRMLFEGSRPLSKGGAACISCHNVRGAGPLGGGTLAKDLTFVYARLGDAGLTSALETTPFPLMKEIFAKAPLSSEEAFQVKAYLYAASLDGSQPTPDHNFFYLGVGGLGAALGLIGAAWSGRMRGGARRRIAAKHPGQPGERGES